jgi:hypothetical protein
MARSDALWVVNVETGEPHLLDDGFVHSEAARISPGGTYIAILSGTWWGDACYVGYGLAILELDDALRPVAKYRQADFAGLPTKKEGSLDEDESFHPESTGDLTLLGLWLNDTQLLVEFRWACVQNGSEGIYLIDLTRLQASKVSELQEN